jgi:membrane-associated phospholipid phosphatase
MIPSHRHRFEPTVMSSIQSHRRAHPSVLAAVLFLSSCFGLCSIASAAEAGGDDTSESQKKAPPASAAESSPVAATLAPAPYKFQPGVICPLCELTPQFPLGRSGLHWHGHWRQAGVREYVTISGLAAGTVAVRFLAPPATSPSWTGPVLFDSAVRDALRIDSAGGRKTAATISDALFAWEVLHPTVIDPLLFAWWLRESPFVAWQMMLIDAQAYAFTFFMSDVVKRVAARQRPWVSTEDCAQNPDGKECGSGGRYMSFYSGHAAVTATGAGLICAHHTQLSLYQNDLLDTGTCALAIAGTALTGAMRIASDNHWASDVIIGHLMGYTSGYLLPTLLYYKEFRVEPHDHPMPAIYATLPMITPESVGLSVLGIF